MTHKRQSFLTRGLVQAVLIFICILWTLPSAGLLISSFRPEDEIRSSGWWTIFAHPTEFTMQLTLENYERVLGAQGMGTAFLNSLAVAIPATVIPLTIAAFAAYGFAWMRFPGRRWLFVLVVGLLVVPAQVALIPILRLYTQWGLNGTYLAVWLAHTGFGMPLSVYLLYNYVNTLPREIMESATIDGCSHFDIFTRIVIPLSLPALASLVIFQFLWVWNDLLIAVVFLGGAPDVAVVTQRLATMVGQRGQDWHVLTAGAFVTMTLPLLVFFSLQRYFVRGLLAGSVKG